jgi:hypothetical protein
VQDDDCDRLADEPTEARHPGNGDDADPGDCDVLTRDRQ